MHFALLLPQLPHIDDNRAQYSRMLTLAAKPNRVRAAALALRSAVARLLG